MATLKTKFSVGLFLIVGMAIIIVGVIWFGMTNYFQTGRLWVTYFDESVQGLDRDSAVKYRGVNIGRVQTIGIAPDENLIEVVMQIEADVKFEAIKPQLSAQLKSVGITGLVFIELDRIPDGQVLTFPPTTFDPPYPVLPSRPSEMIKFFQGVEDVFATLRALDTQAISDELVQAIQKVNKAIDDAQLDVLTADIRATVNNMQHFFEPEMMAEALDAIEQTANSLNRTAVNADGGIDEMRRTIALLDDLINTSGGDIQEVTADLRESAKRIKDAMEGAVAVIESSDQTLETLQRQTLQTLQRIDMAGDTLNRFLDRIVADPSQLFFSGSRVEKPAAP